MVAAEDIVLNFGEPFGVKEVFDYVLIGALGLSFEFAACGAETGATVQVSHEGDLLVRHVRLRMLGLGSRHQLGLSVFIIL